MRSCSGPTRATPTTRSGSAAAMSKARIALAKSRLPFAGGGRPQRSASELPPHHALRGIEITPGGREQREIGRVARERVMKRRNALRREGNFRAQAAYGAALQAEHELEVTHAVQGRLRGGRRKHLPGMPRGERRELAERLEKMPGIAGLRSGHRHGIDQTAADIATRDDACRLRYALARPAWRRDDRQALQIDAIGVPRAPREITLDAHRTAQVRMDIAALGHPAQEIAEQLGRTPGGLHVELGGALARRPQAAGRQRARTEAGRQRQKQERVRET